MKSLILISALVLLTMHKGDCLKCYTCNSEGDGDCAADKLKEEQSIDCGEGGDACAFIRSEKKDKIKYTRTCANTKTMEVEEKDDECHHCSSFGDSMSSQCLCFEDNCNGAMGAAKVSVAAMLACALLAKLLN